MYENGAALVVDLATRMQVNGVRPEIELFDLSHIHGARRLIDAGLMDERPHVQVVMGVKNALPAEERLLDLMLGEIKRVLPHATWTAAGIGANQARVMEWALARHADGIRTGLEDNIRVSRDRLAASNAELVSQAAEALARHGARPTTTAEARSLLSVSPPGPHSPGMTRFSALTASGISSGAMCKAAGRMTSLAFAISQRPRRFGRRTGIALAGDDKRRHPISPSRLSTLNLAIMVHMAPCTAGSSPSSVLVTRSIRSGRRGARGRGEPTVKRGRQHRFHSAGMGKGGTVLHGRPDRRRDRRGDCDEGQRADERRMGQRERLGNHAADRKPDHVRRPAPQLNGQAGHDRKPRWRRSNPLAGLARRRVREGRTRQRRTPAARPQSARLSRSGRARPGGSGGRRVHRQGLSSPNSTTVSQADPTLWGL